MRKHTVRPASRRPGQLTGNATTSTGSFTPVVLAVFNTPRLRSGLIFASPSQIDDDVPSRSRAANEKVAVGGLLERLRFIGDGARNQTAFTVVTNTGPA